jgi:PAS domain-containing protein
MSTPPKIQHVMEYPAADTQHGFALKLMELLVVPTFVLDLQGKVIIWNRACERLTGVEAWEVWVRAITGRASTTSSAPRWPIWS